jgi:uncharacterized protein (UPF0276 family)
MSSGLGVGVVWWPELNPLCEPSEGLVDVVEAEPEAFWRPWGAGFHSKLPDALAHLTQPKLLHGVGAPLGGTCGPPAFHLDTFADDIAALRPAWISEHLSFSRFSPEGARQPVVAGFLLPPVQSAQGVAVAVRNIRSRQSALDVKLAFETAVSYLPPLRGEIPDGVFAATVAETADCGILLDLHNVWCNQCNGRQSVAEFCAALPLDRVWELHVAGGEAQAGFWLDGHSGRIPREVFDIAEELVPRLPNLGAIVFEIMPDRVQHVSLAAIAEDLGRLRTIWDRRGTATATERPPLDAMALLLPAQTWERLIGGALVGGHDVAPEPFLTSWWAEAAPAVALYRTLWAEGRGSALVATAPRTLRLLLGKLGSTATRHLLTAFQNATSPGYTAIEEARAFLPFVAVEAASVPGIRAAVTADAAALG